MKSKNTIVANSTGGNCAGGVSTDNGYNLDNDNSCGLSLAPILYKDPELEVLNDYGGPTQTRKLKAASPAINSGAGCPATDQRGYPRLPAACDIGAYEDTTDNPIPAITTLFPNSKPAGESGFTLTVNGYTYTPFVKGLSVVYWNGSPRPTTFVNTSQLTADITAADLAAAGPIPVTVFNPAQGGGLSNEVIFTVTPTNPFPTITSLSPDTRPAGGPPFTLTINGSNYVDQSSVVRWNGIARPTTFVNDSQLTADIPATDLAAIGTASITVSNSPPGGGISDPPTTFTVTRTNPFPTITTLVPDSRPAGGPAFILTVNGGNFLDGFLSVVLWNGIARPTAFVSPSQLTADIPATDLAAMGTASVTVSNSPPGGGISDPPTTFTIGPPNTIGPSNLYLPLILRN